MASQKDILNTLVSLVEQQNKLHAVTEDRIKAEKEAADKIQESNEKRDEEKASYADVRNTVVKFGSELAKITEAGIKFASVIGTTATSGIQLEVTNRVSLLKQLADFNANQSVTLAQLQSAQQSFTDTFISTR